MQLTECLVIADEADAFRLAKYKEHKHKRLLKKTHKERDIAAFAGWSKNVIPVQNAFFSFLAFIVLFAYAVAWRNKAVYKISKAGND